jgi:hypothetical protein
MRSVKHSGSSSKKLYIRLHYCMNISNWPPALSGGWNVPHVGRLKAMAEKRARGERAAVSDKLRFYHTGLISVKANFVMGRVKRTRTDRNSAKPLRCSGNKRRQNQTAPSRTLPNHWAEVKKRHQCSEVHLIHWSQLRRSSSVHTERSNTLRANRLHLQRLYNVSYELQLCVFRSHEVV